MFESFNNYLNAAPDYNDLNNWAAFHGKRSNALLVPSPELRTNEAPQADVFFIHPTTYMAGLNWNAALMDIGVNEATDIGPIKHQASVFNVSCRIYAPRYRQAILKSFYSSSSQGEDALNLAYEDVKNAFDFYIKNKNEGRPFFIAAHSQGSMHALRLLKDYIDNGLLLNLFIGAYLPGMPISKSELNNIKTISIPGQTACIASWNTYETNIQGYDHFYTNSICCNPLTWSSIETKIPTKNHLGAVPVSFDRVDKNLISAQVIHGKVEIDPIVLNGYSFLNQKGNYHLGDYNLFYLNIRENVKLQVENFLR